MEKDVQDGIFIQITQGGFHKQEVPERVWDFFSQFYTQRKYVILLFKFLDSNKAEKGEDRLIYSPTTILEDVLSSLKGNFDLSYTVPASGTRLISLVSVSQEVSRDTVIMKLQQINKELSNNMPLVSSVGVSRFYYTGEDFAKAYQEAKLSIDFRQVNAVQEVIDVEKLPYQMETVLPVDLKEKIYHFILTSNADECIALIHEILDLNLEQGVVYNKYVQVVTEIFSGIARTLAYCDYDHKDIFTMEQNLLSILEGDFRDVEIRWLLDSIVTQAVKKISHGQEKKLSKTFIIKYINLHYMEGLYLDQMAMVTGTTPKYFSNYFKREFGVNFVDYLNQTRIAHAKELLRNSSLTVSEIGERVGYLSSSTFATTFKKYSGVSPTQYREHNKQ